MRAVSLAWAASAPGEGVPRPEGWIGTTEQWTQGLGIALVLLNLIILVLAWRRLSRGETPRQVLGLLFVGLLLLPVIVIFFGYTQGMAGMETVQACGGCHVMTSRVEDLHDPDSESLAAIHYKNRFIREHQCYTCHADYGMLGTITAKMNGVGHIVHHLRGDYPLPLKIAHPYPNVRCLACHAESQRFLKSAGHPPEMRPELMSGQTSCLTCHGPAHTPKEATR